MLSTCTTDCLSSDKSITEAGLRKMSRCSSPINFHLGKGITLPSEPSGFLKGTLPPRFTESNKCNECFQTQRDEPGLRNHVANKVSRSHDEVCVPGTRWFCWLVPDVLCPTVWRLMQDLHGVSGRQGDAAKCSRAGGHLPPPSHSDEGVLWWRR